ncbi:hypothetical protein OQA88_8074 [Cercophora sp. LCS_1]
MPLSGNATRWFRRRSRANEPVLPTTPNFTFVPPPDVESLPPYSEVPEDASSAPSSTNPLPPPPNAPPPEYQPPATTSQRQPQPPQLDGTPKTPLYTLSEQRTLLKEIFTRHPWRRIWGEQPVCFVDALNRAALLGNEVLLAALFDLGVEVHGNLHRAVQVTTPTHEALRGPKPWFVLTFLQRLRDSGGEPSELLLSRDINGCTPLHIAAEAGETAIARTFVLFYSMGVNITDNLGRTPLHMAARYGREETVRMLLDCGADPGTISEELWNKFGRDEKKKELLGSYVLISALLKRVLETGSTAEPDEFDFEREMTRENRPRDEQHASTTPGITMAVRPASTSASTSVPLSQHSTSMSDANPNSQLRPEEMVYVLHPGSKSGSEPASAYPQLRRNSLNGGLHLDPTAARLAAAYGENEVEAAQRVLRHRRAGSSSQRPFETMIYTPEYAVWKRGCEILQDQSRAQRRRNMENDWDFGH